MNTAHHRQAALDSDCETNLPRNMYSAYCQLDHMYRLMQIPDVNKHHILNGIQSFWGESKSGRRGIV